MAFWRIQKPANVSEVERWASLVCGGPLILKGLKRWPLAGMLLALTGSYLIYRGVSGYDPLYRALGISSAREEWGVSRHHGVHVERSVTVKRPAEELYNFWRDFANLPRVMSHLRSVQVFSEDLSHWTAKAPFGKAVEWDAEVVGDVKNRLISWRSLPGTRVPNAGSVRFHEAPEGNSTEVRVALKYNPPGGLLGSLIARLFGEEPGQQLEDDLKRFKDWLERREPKSPPPGADEVTEASWESFPASDAPGWTGMRLGGGAKREDKDS